MSLLCHIVIQVIIVLY